MTTISRREEEKDSKRLDILNAAQEIFDQKGFEQSTIEEIAQSSRLSIGTIYNFFKNKESLYEQILENLFSEFLKNFEKQTFHQKKLSDALRKMIEMRLEYYLKHKGFFTDFFESAFKGAFAKSNTLKKRCLDFRSLYIEKVVLLLQKYPPKFFVEDLIYLALSMEGTLQAIISHKAFRLDVSRIDETIEKVFLIFKRLIDL